MDMQQPTADASQPMTVRLPLQDWNAVLAAVNELPHRVARQIFDSLLQQLRQQAAVYAEEAEHAQGGFGEQSNG